MSTLELRQECQRLLNLRPVFLECKPSRLEPQAEVVELALIDSDGSLILDELVRPKRRIKLAAVEVHGITNEIAKQAQPWTECWPKVDRLIYGRLVGIFGRELQLGWLTQSVRADFLRWNHDPEHFFCIQKVHAEFQAEWDPATRAFRTYTLENAATLTGLNPEPSEYRRRALEDARLARAIMLVMAGWVVQ
jgi:DNA polymerase III epsilon subunit-like protein